MWDPKLSQSSKVISSHDSWWLEDRIWKPPIWTLWFLSWTTTHYSMANITRMRCGHRWSYGRVLFTQQRARKRDRQDGCEGGLSWGSSWGFSRGGPLWGHGEPGGVFANDSVLQTMKGRKPRGRRSFKPRRYVQVKKGFRMFTQRHPTTATVLRFPGFFFFDETPQFFKTTVVGHLFTLLPVHTGISKRKKFLRTPQ